MGGVEIMRATRHIDEPGEDEYSALRPGQSKHSAAAATASTTRQHYNLTRRLLKLSREGGKEESSRRKWMNE